MKTNVRTFTLCAVFAAVTAILSQISFSMGPVPFSMGIFAVMLCGGLLEPFQAFISQLVYLAIGAVGIPVFSGFSGGISVLLGFTGGFLMLYPVTAMIISLFFRIHTRSALLDRIINGAGYIAGLAVCYVAGGLWYSWLAGISVATAFGYTVIPFIIPDIIKASVAYCLTVLLSRRLKYVRS